MDARGLPWDLHVVIGEAIYRTFHTAAYGRQRLRVSGFIQIYRQDVPWC
jgi:hypothetical protein